MHEPWGTSGPQFLVIYGSALALTLMVDTRAGAVSRRSTRPCGTGPQTTATLRTLDAVSAPVRSIGNDLCQRGLATVASARFATGVVLVYAALFVVGLVRSVNGFALHRPTAGLNVLLAITAVLSVLAVASRRRPKVHLTKAGRTMVVAVRTDPVAQRAQSGALLIDAASLVALDGLAQYPDHATSLGLKSGAGSSSGGGGCGGRGGWGG